MLYALTKDFGYTPLRSMSVGPMWHARDRDDASGAPMSYLERYPRDLPLNHYPTLSYRDSKSPAEFADAKGVRRE